jgi:lia operon protein LiaG
VSKPLGVGVALLALAPQLWGQASKTYSIVGNEVAIYNLAGEITIRGGSGNAVTVDVTMTGPDAGRLTVETGEARGVPALRIIYPDDRIVYPAMGRGSNTNFTIRSDGTWGDFAEDHGRHRDEGRRITIRGDGSGLEAAANLLISIPAGRKVGVRLGVGKMEVSNVDGTLDLDAASGSVSARGTRGSLSIDTGSGDVRVESANGKVSLDTGSGDVTITTLKNGVLDIDTGSGSVTGSGVEASRVSIETGSGDIRLTGIAAPQLDLETGSGSVRAELTASIEELSVETGSGDVTINLPDGTSATIDLDTGSGDFSVDVPVQLIKKGEGSLQGRIGDGRGRIHIETGSGDIALVK